MIFEGDKIYLGHSGEVRCFKVYRVLDSEVILTWEFENVIQLKRVPKAKLLRLLAKGA